MSLGEYDEIFEADRAQHGGESQVSMPWLEEYRSRTTQVPTLEPAIKDQTPQKVSAPKSKTLEGLGSTQRGGAEAATPAAPVEQVAPDELDESLEEQVVQDHEDLAPAAPAPEPSHDETEHIPPVSLQFTDQQDAVQAAVDDVKKPATEAKIDLPRTGFKINSSGAQPHVRNLPDVLVDRLREQLVQTLVREFNISHREADGFASRLSQGSLVTAFLMAALDVVVDVDAATKQASTIFRQQDSMLAAILTRLDGLESRGVTQHRNLEKITTRLKETQETSAVLEYGISYLLADRVENLSRGVNSAADLNLGQKGTLVARDKVRTETSHQLRREREREGRSV